MLPSRPAAVPRRAARLCRTVLWTLCLSLGLASCQWGQRAERLPAAITPAGATVRLQGYNPGSSAEGELYAVDSTGVLLHDGRLRQIAWSELRSFLVLRFGDAYRSSGGVVPPEEKRRRIAAVSRFPQGLEGELLARVLAQLQQPSVERLP